MAAISNCCTVIQKEHNCIKLNFHLVSGLMKCTILKIKGIVAVVRKEIFVTNIFMVI